MTQIVFIDFEGTQRTVDARPGRSVMLAALDHAVPGIVAECGGGCSCATCHVYVDPDWIARVGEPSESEQMLLEGAVNEPRETSRLSCQIIVTEALDGLRVTTPESQY